MSGLVLAIASPRAQQPTFRAGVELVTVPVTVTSLDRNTHIAGLTAADFKVSENGDRQEVTVVTRERVPISLGMVIDSGEGMAVGMRRYMAAEAAQRIVAALQPDDEVAILFVRKTVEDQAPVDPRRRHQGAELQVAGTPAVPARAWPTTLPARR